jgi:UDPglucose--hexose-1-phosphate uridylyltransferase
MHTTSTRLADGRECVFYDRRPVDREILPDRRALPPRPDGARLRLDPRTGEWVVVAAHRQDRTHQPGAGDCPFCPTRGDRLTEVPAADYEVVVFENRFPALSGAGEPPFGIRAPVPGETVDVSAEAYGRCEVICFSSDHDGSFTDLKPDEVRLVVDAWTDRTRIVSAIPGIVQVYCFENRGPEIGVTQPHPHGQMYAYPFVTPRTARMLERAAAHREATGRNLFDDALTAEHSDGTRIVTADDHWTAFVPYAARWPYEVHLYPHRRHRDLTTLSDPERDSLARIWPDVLQRFDRLFDAPAPYIAAWHQAPAVPGADEFALHLEVFTNRRSPTRLKHPAGTEAGMDVFSNDVAPEQAAARLREARA